jgi:copper resistance protein B
MKQLFYFIVMQLPLFALADMQDMHKDAYSLVKSINFHQLEWQKNAQEEAMLAWDFSTWISGGDEKWWLKSEGKASENDTEGGYVQMLYSEPVSAFWDLQIGFHSQIEPYEENYVLIGFFGLAPYFIHLDSYLLLNSNGDAIWQLDADYDMKLSRNWVMLVEGSISAQAQNKPEAGLGSGLSEGELGIRVAYNRQRKLVPYIGIEWERAFGNTADIRDNLQEPNSEWRGVVGINMWY